MADELGQGSVFLAPHIAQECRERARGHLWWGLHDGSLRNLQLQILAARCTRRGGLAPELFQPPPRLRVAVGATRPPPFAGRKQCGRLVAGSRGIGTAALQVPNTAARGRAAAVPGTIHVAPSAVAEGEGLMRLARAMDGGTARPGWRLRPRLKPRGARGGRCELVQQTGTFCPGRPRRHAGHLPGRPSRHTWTLFAMPNLVGPGRPSRHTWTRLRGTTRLRIVTLNKSPGNPHLGSK